MTARRFLIVTLVVNLALCVAGIAAAWALGPVDVALGVAVGAVLGTLNLVGLGWACGRLLRPTGRKWPYGLALGLKFALLIAAVYAAVTWIPMDAFGFVGGLSASGLALLGATTWLAAGGHELTFDSGTGR